VLAPGTAAPSAPQYSIRLLSAADITPALIDAWRDLATRAAEPNPFAEPECAVPALTHLDSGRASAVLTVGEGDRLDAVLPVTWGVPIGRFGRWHPRAPLWEATTAPYRPLSTPLLDATRPVEAWDALLRGLERDRRPAVALALRTFRDDGPVAAALDESLRRRGLRALRTKTYQRAVLVRDGGVPRDLKGRRYVRIRRARRRLDEQVGPSILTDRGSDPTVAEEFLRLEASGWKGRAGTAIACRPGHAAWFREVCVALAREGRLEVLSLEVGGKTIGMDVAFVSAGTAFHLKTAYDEEFSDYLPGMQPLLHLVEELPGGDMQVRDSCTVPDNQLMSRLWPDRRTFSTVLVPLHGMAASLTLSVLRGSLAAGERLSAAWAARATVQAPTRPARPVTLMRGRTDTRVSAGGADAAVEAPSRVLPRRSGPTTRAVLLGSGA
jgi:CelD/BcsL family acetyltransferase involved in cellulose biosynthesis